MTLDLPLLRASWRSWCSVSSFDRVGPAWLQYVWTFFFNTVFAILLTLAVLVVVGHRVNARDLFLANMLFSHCIGYTIHVLLELSARLLGKTRISSFSWWQRVAYFCGVPIIGLYIGYAIAFALRGQNIVEIVQRSPSFIAGTFFLAILISAILYQFFRQEALVAMAEAERERERARAFAAEKQSLDAQLRALQAQIEPHFLFNTLANVASLIDSSPQAARRMLAQLIELLRARLGASRAAFASVAQEVELVRAYLDILAIRMGDRLHYSIDVPAQVLPLPLPPLLLQPLVENAIRHGLEPKVEGGHVKVVATIDAQTLRFDVVDDGLGFAPTTAGGGVGLANLRERLRGLFGERARLSIEEMQPGTRVRIELPLPAA